MIKILGHRGHAWKVVKKNKKIKDDTATDCTCVTCAKIMNAKLYLTLMNHYNSVEGETCSEMQTTLNLRTRTTNNMLGLGIESGILPREESHFIRQPGQPLKLTLACVGNQHSYPPNDSVRPTHIDKDSYYKKCPDRFRHQIMCVLTDINHQAYKNCPHNIVCGMMERTANTVHQPSLNAVKDFTEWA